MATKSYVSTTARIAGNLLSGQFHSWVGQDEDDKRQLAREAVLMAYHIIAEAEAQCGDIHVSADEPK